MGKGPSLLQHQLFQIYINSEFPILFWYYNNWWQLGNFFHRLYETCSQKFINILLYCCCIIWIQSIPCFDVLVVWLYPIWFDVELSLMECLSNICTSKQKHPYIPLAISPIPTPSLVVNLNSPSPFKVLFESPNSDLLTIVLLWVSSLLYTILEPWVWLEFHQFEHSLVGVYSLF